MTKAIFALAIIAVAMVGCSQKADVGDANVKLAPGTAKVPTASGGTGVPQSGPGPTAHVSNAGM